MSNSDATVNPNDFVIVRKRKQYRFALFHNAENCFELEQWRPMQGLVIGDGKLVVEIGAGTGLFLVELARLHPEQTYVALDVKADRLQKGARQALELGLSNIYFVRARADQLLEVVDSHTVDDIWLTFSDPFPKKRDAKRRLTYAAFLEIYKNALVLKNAHLNIKTDSHQLFDWSLEQLIATKWQLEELSFDLHESELPNEYKIMTTYERRWRAEGLPIYFASAVLKSTTALREDFPQS